MQAEARSRGSMPIAIGITTNANSHHFDHATGCIWYAIVWQDRRTTDICTMMKNAGKEAMVTEKTGLLLDPYFTATKLSDLDRHATAPWVSCASALSTAFSSGG